MKTIKKHKKVIILSILAISIAVLLILYFSRNDISKTIFSEITLRGMVLLSLPTAVTLVCNAYCMKIAANTLGTRLSTSDWLGVYCTSTLINSIVPLKLGTIAAAIYYSKTKQLDYSKYLAVFSGQTLIAFLSSIFQIFVAIPIIAYSGKRASMETNVLIVTCLVALALVLTMAWLCRRLEKVLQNKEKYRRVFNVLHSFNMLLSMKGVFVKLLCMIIAGNLFTAIRMQVGFSIAGFPINFIQALLYSGTTTLAAYFSILPGNLGINEALLGTMNALVGKSYFEAGASIAWMIRLVGICVTLVFSALNAFPLVKKYRRGIHNDH